MNRQTDLETAQQHLRDGSFSALEPYFDGRVQDWAAAGVLGNDAELLTCACFLGNAELVTALLDRGTSIGDGRATGMNGFHWAANRSQVDVVKLLVSLKTEMETLNQFGGTVLGTAV